MYLVAFFLLLWTLFQCILCENCIIQNSHPHTLYILSARNDMQDMSLHNFLRNSIHRTDLSNTLDYLIVLKTNCPRQLQDALNLTKTLRYVIYYGITDFYKNNYNDVRNSNMEWAGDYGHLKPLNVCKSDKGISNDKSPIREIREGRANEACSYYKMEERQYTFLTSKNINIAETPGIYNLIHTDELHSHEYHIIVCTGTDSHNRILFKDIKKTIHVRYLDLDICQDSNYLISFNVIAIIAPGPEYVTKLDYYANKPIIFYEEIYNHQMVDTYENAVIRKTVLKHKVTTLLKLILKRWKRVAILSDHSVESGPFENEVRTLLEKYGVSYTVRSVGSQSKCCDFNEDLSFLKSVDARIIIANVDQKYANMLVKQAQKKGMTMKQNILWIARAWSNATCLKAAKDLETLLTITVDPNPDDALKVILGLFQRDQRNEYSGYLTEAKFAQDIRQYYSKYHNLFKVLKTARSGYQFIGNPDDVMKMLSDRGQCTLKSDNFNKPCDDISAVIFALVIVVLAVTVLGITYFFETPDTPYNRMLN